MSTKLRRETLAEQMAEQLLLFIEEKQLQPGDYLPSEFTLAQTFEVSRPIIREALRSLEARRIIQTTTGKRAMVKPASADPLLDLLATAVRLRHYSMLDLLEARRGIEIQCAVLAARRRTSEDSEKINHLVHEMREHLQLSDEYTRLDVEFHLAIAAASRNMLLLQLVQSLREPLQASIQEGLLRRSHAEEFEKIQMLHEAVALALTRGDEQEAVLAMTAHFDDAVMAISTASFSVDSTERVDQPLPSPTQLPISD